MPKTIPASAAPPTTTTGRDVTTIIRPTEAQLRYFQFHHQRKSQAVKHYIERLYQTPLEVEDTTTTKTTGSDNHESDSCNSSGSSSDDTDTTAVRVIRKQRRPVISAGRKALLKRSRKQYRNRRKEILKNGYRGFAVVVASDENTAGAAVHSGDGKIMTSTIQEQEKDDRNDADRDDPELEEIFMTRPKSRRHHIPQSGRRNQQDKESFKRFQAACHAMMMNIKTSHVTAPIVAAPTKRWKRSEQHIRAAEEMQHSDFLDYKWGVRKRSVDSYRSRTLLLSAYYHQNHQMMDRGASWMIHLPKHVQYNRDTPYYQDIAELPPDSTISGVGSDSDFTASTLAMRTPGRKKFNMLVAFVQQRLIQKERDAAAEAQRSAATERMEEETPKMRLRNSHLPVEEEERKTSRAKEISKIFETGVNKEVAQTSGIRYQTPTMKLRNSLDFGVASEDESFSRRKSMSSEERRARYVPRMRLRDFDASSTDLAKGEEDVAETIPRRRLVHSFNLEQHTDDAMKVEGLASGSPTRRCHDGFRTKDDASTNNNGSSKAKEIVSAIERSRNSSQSTGRNRQMAKTLGNERRPSMNNLENVREEKKTSEDEPPISPETAQRLLGHFQNKNDIKDTARNRSAVAKSGSAAGIPGGNEAKNKEDTVPSQAQRRVDSILTETRYENMDATPRQNSATRRKTFPSQNPERANTSTPIDYESTSEVSRGSNLSNISGLLNRGRSSMNALAASLNTIAETHVDNLPPEVKESASNVSDRVSGFFNKLRNQTQLRDKEGKTSVGQAPEEKEAAVASLSNQEEKEPNRESIPFSRNIMPAQSEDSHEALAAYRKKRETLSPDVDKASEASSYYALPRQIRDVVQNSKASSALVSSNGKSFETPTTPQSEFSTRHSTRSELSHEKYRQVHERVMQNSMLLGDYEQDSIIDTDDVNFGTPEKGVDLNKISSLMMSPDVLQKRLKQAVRAIENRNWEQVSYLTNANPWLAEMKELTTNQYLLHKLAFFGGGSPRAPTSLCERLIEKFPSAVYKFDQDGNVPLHLAAAAGNLPMIKILGERFESGASIRNEDGMLPLHFTIASLSDIAFNAFGEDDGSSEVHTTSLKIVQTVLSFFPKAIAIADNVGNIPLHVAAECLDGGIGVDVVYLLLDEAERQLSDPFGARFHNKSKIEEIIHEDLSTATMSTDKETESSVVDTELDCTMVLNNYNETPLLSAVRSKRGWQMIEALMSGANGHKAALVQDSHKNNCLHLLVGEYLNPTAAMSILKVVPESASVRNARGMLPIELACMQLMPEEVIVAIALVDLPFNIDDQGGTRVHEGRGGSWYFLTCESDDHMVEIVQEIVSICSFEQLRELCFMTDFNSGNTVIDRATPLCREVLNQALRFLGRFEFVGNGPLVSDPKNGYKAFDALDFGGENKVEGTRVILECFDFEEQFENRVHLLLGAELDDNVVEKVDVYVESIEGEFRSGEQPTPQRCVAIERPQLTLDKVVDGMRRSVGYRNEVELRLKYSAKVCSVLRLIGKGLHHLHTAGFVHGNLCMETCGKFPETWKLLERLEIQVAGEPFNASRFSRTFPPESLELSNQDASMYDSDDAPVSFVTSLIAHPSIDIWAFGQVCYEALVGKPLVDYDMSKSPAEDVAALLQIMEWDKSNMHTVFTHLLDSGIEESAADMITSCLFPHPNDRPSSMQDILDHKFWIDMRKYRSKKNRDSMGTTENQTPRSFEV